MAERSYPSPDRTADPESVARTILLRRLTDQPRSRAELAGFLAKKHVPDRRRRAASSTGSRRSA